MNQVSRLIGCTALFLTCALLSSKVKSSDKISYNYFQVGLVNSEGVLTNDKRGYNFDVSRSWGNNSYFRLIYNDQSSDVWAGGLKSKVTATEYDLSLGYRFEITRSTDLFTELGYIVQDASGLIPQSTYGNDGDGYFVKLGLRNRFSSNLEYSIYSSYKDIDTSENIDLANYEDDNDTTFGVGIRYYLSKQWSIGLNAAEEATGLTSNLSFRYNL